MYIKINGSDEHYDASITTFSTQHGNEGVRVIGDMPQTDKGFIVYDDNDKVFNDLSDFVYSYGNNDNEYTKVEEIIEEAECSFEPLPPSSYDILVKRVNRLNNKINNITPYEETKTVYYGENEKIFYGIPQGNILVFFDNYDGEYTVNRVADRVTISFPNRLENITNITIMVQG